MLKAKMNISKVLLQKIESRCPYCDTHNIMREEDLGYVYKNGHNEEWRCRDCHKVYMCELKKG